METFGQLATPYSVWSKILICRILELEDSQEQAPPKNYKVQSCCNEKFMFVEQAIGIWGQNKEMIDQMFPFSFQLLGRK